MDMPCKLCPVYRPEQDWQKNNLRESLGCALLILAALEPSQYQAYRIAVKKFEELCRRVADGEVSAPYETPEPLRLTFNHGSFN